MIDKNSPLNTSILTIFYDGQCPLCCAEMRKLKKLDKCNQINLINIHSQTFIDSYPDISFDSAMSVLHGIYKDKLLLGLEVTHRAWSLVGKGFWLAPLNWPLIKPISHGCYLIVAKYRQPISSALAKVFNMDTTQCKSGVCFDNKPNTHHRGK